MPDRNIPRKNFLSLEPQWSGSKDSKFVILPVPYEKTTTYGKGTEAGPQAILKASHYVEYFDEELLLETFRVGIHTSSPLKTKRMPYDRVSNKIYQSVRAYLNLGKTVALLGGEHSITPSAVYAFKEKYVDFSVLQIDAHADLRDSFGGSKWNHACAMRRVIEVAPLVQVGIRSISREEHEFAKRVGQANKIYFAQSWSDRSIKGVISQLRNNVYVTIDVDGLDPSVIPSTGTPEPGGLSWYRLIKLLKEVSRKRRIVGFDVVELSPIKNLHAPDFAIAKLIYKLIGYVVTGKK